MSPLRFALLVKAMLTCMGWCSKVQFGGMLMRSTFCLESNRSFLAGHSRLSEESVWM